MVFRKAILIIHGFAGGTYDEEPLLFHLQPKLEFDVYNFTLPGHMTNLSSDVVYTDWIDAVNKRIDNLINMGYNKIYLIGHSMGGVLATHAAIKYPEVKKIILIAPAFKYLSTEDQNSFMKAIKFGPDIIKTYHFSEVVSRFLKVSVSQYKEFQKLVNLSQENPQKLVVPTLIIQGTSDKIVPFESSEKIFEEMKCPKWLIKIDGVTHDVFYGVKVSEICDEIYKFLKVTNYREESIRDW